MVWLVTLLGLALGCSSAKPFAGQGAPKNAATASKGDPKPRPQFYITMAQLQVRKDDLRGAEANFQKALSLDPKCVAAYAGLGRIYDTQHDYLKAEKTYQAGLKAHPKSVLLWNDLGLCHAHAGRLDAAIKAFEKAVSLAPENSMYHNNLGTVMAMAGMPEEALGHFGLAVGPADAHYNVAYLLKQRGLHEQAVPYLKKALQLNPQHAAAANLLAQLRASDAERGTAAADGKKGNTSPAPHRTSPLVAAKSSKPLAVKQAAAKAQPVERSPVSPAAERVSEATAEPVVHAVAAFPLVPVGSSEPAAAKPADTDGDEQADQAKPAADSRASAEAPSSESAAASAADASDDDSAAGEAEAPAESASGSTAKE